MRWYCLDDQSFSCPNWEYSRLSSNVLLLCFPNTTIPVPLKILRLRFLINAIWPKRCPDTGQKRINVASSQGHTLPKRDYMHFISEVIILNNHRHQHKKTATTNNKINSKIKQQHKTFVDWCYCLMEVLFQKLFGCCLQVYLAWTTILLPNRQGE